jgi:thioredoxin 1
MTTRTKRPYPLPGTAKKLLASFMVFAVAAFAASACGAAQDSNATGDGGDGGAGQTPAPDAGVALLTEVNLDELLAQGLPVILNFGDDSQDSIDTLSALGQANKEHGGGVLVVTVDLAQNPKAREGFPIQTIPSQFFYMADGRPISLPMSIGVIMSTFLSVDTEEPIFTIHEGRLTEDDLQKILVFMGVA